jgi:hypothetical protein
MALERPLCGFVHPHFCVCVKPLRGFFQRKRKNVANLLSLGEMVAKIFGNYKTKYLTFLVNLE